MLRNSLRIFRRNPFITILGVAILAIGVGSSLSIYSLLDMLLSPRPPGVSSGAFASIGVRQESGPLAGLTWTDYKKLSIRLSDGADVSACSFPTDATVEFDNGSATLPTELISNNYLQSLGARLLSADPLLDFDEGNSNSHVALIRSDHARRWFGLPNNALDRIIKINGEPFRIVGVVALPFSGALNSGVALWLPPQAFIPLFLRPSQLSTAGRGAAVPATGPLNSSDVWKSANIFYGIAKGRTGTREQELAPHLTTLLQKRLPDLNLQVVPGLETDPEHRAALLSWAKLTLALAIALFVVAALNFSAFLLAQIPGRLNEMRLRRSLGATSYHLIFELMRGPAVLLIFAAISGAAMAVTSRSLVLRLSPFVRKDITYAVPVPSYGVSPTSFINSQSLIVLVGLALTGFILIAVLPALELLRTEKQTAQGLRATSSTGTRRLLLTVIAFQACLALGSTLSAAFLVKGLVDLQSVNPGFSTANVMIAQIGTVPGETPIVMKNDTGTFPLSMASRAALQDLDSIGSIEGSAMAKMIPLSGKPDYLRVPQNNGVSLTIAYNAVTRNYFKILGIRFVQGNTFSGDSFAGTPDEAVVSRKLAQVLWPGQAAVGNTIEVKSGDKSISVRVVGVVEDVYYDGPSRSAGPLLYLPPQGIYFPSSPMFVVRGNISPRSMASVIGKHIHDSVPGLTVSKAFPLESAYYLSFKDDRMRVRLGCAAGAILLALAIIGVYGVTTFRVAERRRELAVRICVGARAGSLVRLVLQEIGYATSVALMFTILGWIAWDKTLLQYVPSGSLWNPTIWTMSIVIWLLAITIAAVVPSIQVIRIHPAEVLKSE
jgi:predicted permease